jgi:type 1 glutamine amidotransferase
VPVEATDSFLPFLAEQGFDVRVEDSPAVYADAAVMTATDLVVQCVTMSSIEKDEFEGLRSAVEAGTGLAGWHGGIADSYRGTASYLHLVGGQFAEHPGKHPDERQGDASDNYVPYRVELTEAGREHPITAGVPDFDLTTEQYWVLADDYVDVLATTTQAVRSWDPWTRPVTSPAIWTRQWGRGKIFVCTPGHSMDVLDDPTVRGIIERGLLWAAR